MLMERLRDDELMAQVAAGSESALESLVAHPSTARQVCLELCEAYVAKPAPEANPS